MLLAIFRTEAASYQVAKLGKFGYSNQGGSAKSQTRVCAHSVPFMFSPAEDREDFVDLALLLFPLFLLLSSPTTTHSTQQNNPRSAQSLLLTRGGSSRHRCLV